ncbi:MAG TPA: VOC family protein [Polyangiaceae bacterium]|jgi:catechol 2,3-dioxygenase-like lactoylglutathione lyase family enzyme
MLINHLDLHVSDVVATAALLEGLLDLRITSNRTSAALVVLEDDAGFTLVLQRRKEGAPSYPEGFHFGCLVAEEATVDRFHERARGCALEVSDVQRNNRGVLCYARIGDGILLEVSCHRPRAPIAAR